MNDFIDQSRESRIQAYKASPGDIREHFGIEQGVLAGGYGYRQVLELVQNGADAILEAHESGGQDDRPRIEVLLDGSFLYVANTGAPVSKEGIDALLRSHSSPKRGNQIGRFGLGFKSLLRLGGKIDITSGQAAFGFDPERCRTELRDRFQVQDAPRLRLAWPLAETAATTLRDRFPWATTVVSAEIKAERFHDHLRKEISDFPAEFLLFLPIAVSLTLNTGVNAKPRLELCRESDGQDVILYDGRVKSPSRWRVVEKVIHITDHRAKDDATHVHTRDEVPLAWAMPIEGKREEAGRFWAFFPTHTPTYLPGILNAPWKLNSDRNAVISGEWNTALMKEAANLIADTLPQLRSDDDPGRVLDAFPRQLERKDEDAAPLIEALWACLKAAPVIPDATGHLRPASNLWLHPMDNIDLAMQWQSLANAQERSQIAHPSSLEGQRSSRLKALADQLKPKDPAMHPCPNLRKREVEDWFAAVASTETARAIEVLKLAELYKKGCKYDEWDPIRSRLAIAPCDDGILRTSNQTVFAPEGAHIPDGRHPVAKKLCDNPEVKRILTEVLGVKPLDNNVWHEVLDRALPQYNRWQKPTDEQWRGFWTLLQSAPQSVRQEFANQNVNRVCVRRRDGEWVLPKDVLFPGELVSTDDTSPNQEMLVDGRFHCNDDELLKVLGVCTLPDGDEEFKGGDSFSDWLNHHKRRYRAEHNNKANSDYLGPLNLFLPKSLSWLAKLTGSANANLTKRLLDRVRDMSHEPVVFGHTTRPKYYGTINVQHPLRWFLVKYGTVQIGSECIPIPVILAKLNETALSLDQAFKNFKPTIESLNEIEPQIDVRDDKIKLFWQALIKALVTPAAMANDSLRELWTGAAHDKVVPQSLPSADGNVPLAEVFVTGSPDLARRGRNQGHVAITLDADSLSLWLEKGARNLAELMKPEWSEETSPEGLLVEPIPELADVLRTDIRETARCQPVSDLRLRIAGDASPVPCLMWEKKLFLDMAQLASLSRSDRLQHLLAEASAAGWLKPKHTADEALRILGDAQVDKIRKHVARGYSLAERLLLAVGNREEPLRQALGGIGGMDFLQTVAPMRLAELVLAQRGPATLTDLKETLKQEGLKPPARWNTAEARAFVASIGFPYDFAASPKSRPEPEEFISGPIELPPLHGFQGDVLDGIKTLITSGTTRRRAVVSLPTGGGKTRVTVEAAVLHVLKPEGAQRSVIWVAQTGELCEQAVQAFRQVWLNLGAKETDLRIVRLWGSNPNPAIQELDNPVVVVATIQTLNSRMGVDGLAGLRHPGLVVVDECHHAITRSYTNLLRFLDAEAPRPGAAPKDEPPILGLSATPFRTDDEESGRLARRFDSRWLPPDQKDLHSRLRDQGVLAEVANEALESGIDLTPEEIERLSTIPEQEGLDFDNLLESINQRLAGSEQRNEILVSRIKGAEEGSILFFSNSVLHGQEMAARLNLEGISAAAISGDTPATARRYFLSRFQRGQIRVLCNHTVLSTGFDAPKIDMILISRAVFSPVRYMQMVGRGLRGEKNGGKARCRIVTVLDNLGRFQDRHPYHYCKSFFAQNAGRV